jgi:hypothetical protein
VFAGYPKYAFAKVPPILRRIVRLIGASRVAGLAVLSGWIVREPTSQRPPLPNGAK